jgi:hypothetical protein
MLSLQLLHLHELFIDLFLRPVLLLEALDTVSLLLHLLVELALLRHQLIVDD